MILIHWPMKQGDKIETIIGGVKGVITGKLTRSGRQTYEISYFSGGEYRSVWLDKCEFKVVIEEPKKPGFQ